MPSRHALPPAGARRRRTGPVPTRGRPSRLRRRRLRLLRSVVVLAAVAAAAVAGGLALSGPSARSGPSRTAVSTRRPPVASPTTVRRAPDVAPRAARPPALRGLAVTTATVPVVDTRRAVVDDGVVVAPTRSLPTTVWRPVAGGHFPLVVFVHGYDVGPLTYARFCSTLASAGYVVAAPSFPLEDPSRGYGLDRADLPNEATDVSFVITTLVHAPLATHIDAARVAVVGHSDGADVALMVGYQAGRVDRRVAAVVADAPDPMTGPIEASRRPLLLVQGSADDVVPYAASGEVYAQVRAPTSYLTLLGATHLPPIEGGTPWTPVLDAAVADFLDATVAGRGPGATALGGELATSPLVRLEQRPVAPGT